MALTQQQLAEVTAWVDQYAAQTEVLAQQTATAVAAAYQGVNFYSAAAVAAAAEQAADASNTAELIAAGLAAQFLSQIVSNLLGAPVGLPNLPLPPIRNGVDPRQVFDRPAKFFRRLVARGVPADKALEQALRLAQTLADGTVRLAERDASRQALIYLAPRVGITGYRRVIRPELSRTGTCGLCIVASDRIYSTSELMPLHANCKCEPMPIIGELDPGSALNNLTLGDLYGAAADGSGDLRRSGQRRGGPVRRSGTAAEDLKEVRLQINEHGEWGPVLTDANHRFTGRQGLAGVPAPAGGSGGGSLPPTPPAPPVGGEGGDGGDGDGYRARALAKLGAPPDPADRPAAAAYWTRRQAEMAGVVDFGGDSLEPHEVEFVERMLDAGEQLRWIPKAKSSPTNDFLWLSNGGLPTELKSSKARASTIRGRIESAVSKAANHPWAPIAKQNFVIDLGEALMTDDIRTELEAFNVGRHTLRISRLWVMAAGRLTEINLRT